jgi:hypothetical protein
MIFIIDNGGDYSDHCLIFVDAPASFEAWFDGQFKAWHRSLYAIAAIVDGTMDERDGVGLMMAREFWAMERRRRWRNGVEIDGEYPPPLPADCP